MVEVPPAIATLAALSGRVCAELVGQPDPDLVAAILAMTIGRIVRFEKLAGITPGAP